MQKENLHTEFKSSFTDEVIETLVAFANTKGGKVFIGVDDHGNPVKNFSIGVETIQIWLNAIKTKTQPSIIPDAEPVSIKGKKVIQLVIQEFPIKPVSFRGRYFNRVRNSNHQLSLNEISDMYLKTFNTSWDYYINSQFNMEDVAIEKVEAAIENYSLRSGRKDDDPFTFLLKHDLIRDGQVTNAAYLLFKKRESVLTTIELGRFQTETIIKDSSRTKSDILSEVEEVLAFIKKHLNKQVIISGKAQNEERWQYPLDAIREIVTNMIVHRDYRASADSIVKIFDHHIEFFN